MIISNCARYCLRMIGGEGFASKGFSTRLLIKHFIIQKIIRINGHVDWPVHWTSKVFGVEKIKRGTRCPGLANGCHIDGRNGIVIGGNVRIGPRVSLISMNHDVLSYDKYIETKPIVIGENSWLASNVIVLAGVELGEHTIVAAGSVVTKSFLEGNQIIAGNPARSIRRIAEYEKV